VCLFISISPMHVVIFIFTLMIRCKSGWISVEYIASVELVVLKSSLEYTWRIEKCTHWMGSNRRKVDRESRSRKFSFDVFFFFFYNFCVWINIVVNLNDGLFGLSGGFTEREQQYLSPEWICSFRTVCICGKRKWWSHGMFPDWPSQTPDNSHNWSRLENRCCSKRLVQCCKEKQYRCKWVFVLVLRTYIC